MRSIAFEYLGGPGCTANLVMPVSNYSNGWKMKLQLFAAQLMNCDVLTLDEPISHLNVYNIR